LTELIEAGRIVPVVERRYAFDDVTEALDAIGAGHARAKLVLTRSSTG
jgi:NADPH:quinone reductase-like Zn-dependent oxidoreductase